VLIALSEEPLNIALAGESHFRLKKHGIGFWLKARDGTLFHVTGGEEVPLFPIRALTWYVADVVYDIDRGVYDLSIRAEGDEEPLVVLVDQPNAVGLPGSRLHKFSFIGDPPGRDTSNAVFYVEDILISSDRPVPAQGEFVAPGRRMLFVDLDEHYRSLLYERPRCLPALGPADFGFGDPDIGELASLGALDLYDRLADRRAPRPALDGLPPYLTPRLEAMRLWGRGCAAPPGCREPCALELFEAAAAEAPDAKLYPMSAVLALAAEKRWQEADEIFLGIYPEWRGDPRYPAVSALLGIARGDLDEAELWLSTALEELPPRYEHPAVRRLWAGDVDQALVRDLKMAFPVEWTNIAATALIAEHRYYVLLWQQRVGEALDYAARMVQRFRALDLPAGAWLERQGDALFRLGDYDGARLRYEESLFELEDPQTVFTKLSDVHFKLGDLDGERRYREKVYGSLRR
jgi:tetratricopeptide (TPR) repeat protein